jgi:hypothetical protein
VCCPLDAFGVSFLTTPRALAVSNGCVAGGGQEPGSTGVREESGSGGTSKSNQGREIRFSNQIEIERREKQSQFKRKRKRTNERKETG